MIDKALEKQIRSAHIPPSVSWICESGTAAFAFSFFIPENLPVPVLVCQLLKLAENFDNIDVRAFVRVSTAAEAGVILHAHNISRYLSWQEVETQDIADIGHLLYQTGNPGKNMGDLFSQAALQSRVLQNLQLVLRYLLTCTDLDMLHHMFLTGLTAGYGLGFNRAVLFVHDPLTNCFTAEKAIGSLTLEEARGIWELIEFEDQSIEDFIQRYINGDHFMDSSLLGVTGNVCLHRDEHESNSCDGDETLLALTYMGVSVFKAPAVNTLLQKLKPGDEFILAPVKSHDTVWGLVFLDNAFTNRPLGPDLLSMTELFINQTALIWENFSMLESYRKEASIDSLTGVANRNEMEKILDYLFSIEKPDLRFYMLLMDIDNFKQVNDEKGHAFGDRVLVEYSKILTSVLRSEDFVARYGGDEFLIIIRDVPKKKVIEIADRLKHEIFHRLDETVSIGIACYPNDSRSRIELFQMSDTALYQAKDAGKDRVAFYKP